MNASELALAAKFPLLTVEKGQGESLPGYAEEKMAALSHQYKAARPSGWSLFYMNGKLDWNMYQMHQSMLDHPSYCVHNSTGGLCRMPGKASLRSALPLHRDILICDMFAEVLAPKI